MTETITYTGELTVVGCWCGIKHAIPEGLYRKAKSDPNFNVHCPLGHSFVYRVSDTVKERERADRLAQQLASARDDVRIARIETTAARNRERAQKAAKTRIKNRVAAGVCPCCTRSFQNLARHMAGQHPDWTNSGEA